MLQKPYSDSIFDQKIAIKYSDLDFKGRLKTISILNFLQDSSCIHASELGISGFDLEKKNFAWVISRYHIKIIKLPKWNDTIFINTWRTPCKNLYELREFNIKDKNGTDIINATGIWIMVRKENCRPVRLSRFLPDVLSDENYFNSNLSVNEPDILNKKLRLPETVHREIPFKVRMHDLDLNQHVNNAVYLEWAVETIPQKLTALYRPQSIDVSFHKASFYGDNILSTTELLEDSADPVTLHSITGKRQDTPVELARVNIAWTLSEL